MYPNLSKFIQFIQILLNHTLVFIKLYYNKADFLKKANFLQICIFKEIGQLDRDAVNIKNVSNKLIHTFCEIISLKRSLGLCI
jgi:hypothetical protein